MMIGKCNGKRNCAKEIAVGLLGFAAGFAAAKLFCRVKKKKEKLACKCDDYMNGFKEHMSKNCSSKNCSSKERSCNDDTCDINYNVTADITVDEDCDIFGE